MPRLEELLKQQREKVPRPDYSGDAPVKDEDGEEEDEEDTKKANIEATSDEEE